MENVQSKNMSYNTIDLIKLFMACVVVAIHTTDYETFESTFANDLLQYVKCFAVPFFFAVSGYFLYSKLAVLPKEKQDEVYDKALRKSLKMYVIWSIIYLPINIYGEYFEWGHTSPIVIISSLLRGWFFVGQNYGSWIMWYILAYIVALVIIKYLHHVFSYKTIIGFSVLMLVVGWLYNYSHDTFSITLYDNLFKGTRNGFFWGFPCVCAGFVVSMLIENLKNTRGFTLLVLVTMLFAMFYVPTSHRQLLYPVMGGGNFDIWSIAANTF